MELETTAIWLPVPKGFQLIEMLFITPVVAHVTFRGQPCKKESYHPAYASPGYRISTDRRAVSYLYFSTKESP